MLNILVTGISAPAIQGTCQMLRENFDGEKVAIYGVDTNPTVFSESLVDHFTCVPLATHSDYIPTLLELCRTRGIDVVLFHTDREALACAKEREAFERVGTRLLCAEREVLERVVDKEVLYQLVSEAGIAVPAYQVVRQEDCEEVAHRLGYPERDLVVKPPISTGAKGVYRITKKPLPWDERIRLPLATLSKLKQSCDRPLLLMEDLTGDEFSVDAFIGHETELAIPRRRDVIMGGVATQTTLVHRPDLADLTLKIGWATGLRYLYGMQFKCNAQGVPKLLECNPRIQGTSIASLYSGVNLLWMAIRELLGRPAYRPPTPVHGITFTRDWGGIRSKRSAPVDATCDVRAITIRSRPLT